MFELQDRRDRHGRLPLLAVACLILIGFVLSLHANTDGQLNPEAGSSAVFAANSLFLGLITDAIVDGAMDAIVELDRDLRITSLWCMGMNQHTQGNTINRLVHSVHLLSGHFGRPGDAPTSLTGQPSACGTVREVGTLCHLLPGGRMIANAAKFHPLHTMAAVQTGRHVFVEKPHGIDPGGVRLMQQACDLAREKKLSIVSGLHSRYHAGYIETIQRIHDGAIGDIVHYRGSFFSMYGADPLGLLSWRFLVDKGGYGASSDLLSHTVDLATFLVGPVARVLATTETFVSERPLPSSAASHYARGNPGDPTGAVTNEDYVGALAVLESGARATFEACRTFVGPESENAFTVYGTRGAIAWNLERLNQLEVYVLDDGTDWVAVTAASNACGTVPDLAGIAAEQAEQHADGRGLAGPVGAEEAVHLSDLDLQVDAIEGTSGAEGLHEAPGLDGKRGHVRSPLLAPVPASSLKVIVTVK